MSIDALSWAFNLDLPNSGVKLTLLALANYANEEHRTAYPNQKTISEKTCLSTRAIRSHLVALEELGVISRESRKREDGTFTSDLFTLNIGFSPPKTSGRNYRRQNLPSAKNSKNQRQKLPNPVADSAYQEPSLNTTQTKGEPSGNEPTKKQLGLSILNGVDQQVINDFLSIRKAKKSPVTETALKGIKREADRLGYTMEQALTICCERGWAGFKADWIIKEESQNGKTQGRLPNKQEALEQSNRAATAGWLPPELREMKNAN